jgi:predicted short-subunit dehydrogenase-like oxidoreductase (DUF2520 family)
MGRTRIVGSGRAGSAFAVALSAAGWAVEDPLGRHSDLSAAAAGVDLLIVATPDAAIRSVAALIDPVESTLVVHLAGSLGLDVLAGHERRGAIHPLLTLPAGDRGPANLTSGGWFAVAGDPQVVEVVADLGGRAFELADENRVLYHAAACIASNHLVALLGQVERLADVAGVPFEPYLDLAARALGDVADLGPAAALTGPAARGDDATIATHIEKLPESERAAYVAMADLATLLAGR